MNRNVVKALIRLFAVVSGDARTSRFGRPVVEQFLVRLVSKENLEEYLKIYDGFAAKPDETEDAEKEKKRRASSSVKILRICAGLNEELTHAQKGVVLLRLAEFLGSDGELSEKDREFLETVADSFFWQPGQLEEICDFVRGLSADEQSNYRACIGKHEIQGRRQLVRDLGSQEIHILKLPGENIYYLRCQGNGDLRFNGKQAIEGEIMPFSPGAVIRTSGSGNIYHGDIAALFSDYSQKEELTFCAHNIEYRFKNGNQGLHKLSFRERSGNLVGIMGSSGAGKSTLLNVLNGNEKPSAGQVTINGHNLHDEEISEKGLIGYVSQDDLLIGELTVFENLWFNACLCYAGASKTELLRKVYKTLEELGLLAIKNLKVGDPLNKTISGGQRKRLNIALELLREPPVLFVDEPTSGLSSRDSEHIMNLLKELSLKGRLIFVVIHQPSSDIFKMFDRLILLDTGGYPVYYGNPVDSVTYVKELADHVNAVQGECPVCGNINPEQIFDIIEDQEVDEYGKTTSKRKITPHEWNIFYKRSRLPAEENQLKQRNLPEAGFKKPGKIAQLFIYLKRDILSKAGNVQYMAINLLEAPLLALIMAYLLRFSPGESYTLYDNLNIPAYLLVCVISSLFFGLTVSAEEIFRDRGLLRREKFLHLSRGSYLFSKLAVLFALSAIQTSTFIFAGHLTIGFRELFFSDWMILFSTACFANILGLNISSAFNSAVTIYILIPILIIPQLLLSGLMVRFDQINQALRADADRVPISADLMVSRWAFEALAVNHFVNNRAEQPVFKANRAISNANYLHHYWIPKMEAALAGIEEPEPLQLIENELKRMNASGRYNTFSHPEAIRNNPHEHAEKIADYLYQTGQVAKKREIRARMQKDSIIDAFGGKYSSLVKHYTNDQLSRLVMRQDQFTKIIEQKERKSFIRNFEPVYEYAEAGGLLQGTFYSSEKNILGIRIQTLYANTAVIWIMSLLLFLLLYYNGLRRILELPSRMKYSRKK